jgi:uridine kinase
MSTTSTPAVFDALVAEVAQNYRHGRILVAVDGADPEATRRFADALAHAARASGTTTYRASAERPEQYTPDDDATLLRVVLAGFREGTLELDDAITEVPEDAALIVDGRFLLSPRLRGAWHFRVWLEGDGTLSDAEYQQQLLYVRDGEPRAAAEAAYDVSVADAPVRIYSDSC